MLDTVPWFLLGTLIKDLLSKRSEIGVVRNQLLESIVLPHVAFTEHQNVVSASEWIREECDRFDDDFRVFCDSLISRRTVIVPLRKLSKFGDLTLQGSALGTEAHCSVDPNVFGDDATFSVQIGKVVKSSFSSCVY